MAVTGDKGRRLFSIADVGEIGEQNQAEMVQVYDQVTEDIRSFRALLGKPSSITTQEVVQLLAESVLPNMRKLAEVAVVRIGRAEAIAMEAGSDDDDFSLDDDEVELFDRFIGGAIVVIRGLLKTPGMPADMHASAAKLLVDGEKCKSILDEYLVDPAEPGGRG